MSYDNNNRGAIWGNENKQKDTQPDFKGNAVIDGVEYYVSAWKRKAGDNPRAPALSFSVTKKEEVQSNGVQQTQQAIDDDFEDSSIPF